MRSVYNQTHFDALVAVLASMSSVCSGDGGVSPGSPSGNCITYCVGGGLGAASSLCLTRLCPAHLACSKAQLFCGSRQL